MTLALKFPERVAELKSLIDAHAEDLQNNRRPAAFVENPKPLLTSGDGVPTLAEYMGRGGIEVVEVTKPTRK